MAEAYLDKTGLAYFWGKIKAYVATKLGGQPTWYGTCPTAASTAAKVVTTTSGDFVLQEGAMLRVKFTNADTYNGTSTLNVDGTGAKSIMRVGTTAKARYHWQAGEVVDFVYDGTNFVQGDGGVATTTYYGVTKLSTSTSSTSTALAATASAVKAAYDLANDKQDPLTFSMVQHTAEYTVTANGNVDSSIDISQDGLTPISIMGYNTNNDNVLPRRLDIWSDGTVHFVLKNLTSSSITGTLYVKIGYVTNTT